jgi:predicted nucleic acid-binding protein
MKTTDRLVLLDNTVLTNFALVGQENLLLRLWPGVARTTTAAFGEYMAGVAIEVTGTVGILLACVRRDYLDSNQANALLTAMIAAGYRSPVASLDALLI